MPALDRIARQIQEARRLDDSSYQSESSDEQEGAPELAREPAALAEPAREPAAPESPPRRPAYAAEDSDDNSSIGSPMPPMRMARLRGSTRTAPAAAASSDDSDADDSDSDDSDGGNLGGAAGRASQPRAVLGYDTTGDGRLDAFDTNQDGELDTRTARGAAAAEAGSPPPAVPQRWADRSFASSDDEQEAYGGGGGGGSEDDSDDSVDSVSDGGAAEMRLRDASETETRAANSELALLRAQVQSLEDENHMHVEKLSELQNSSMTFSDASSLPKTAKTAAGGRGRDDGSWMWSQEVQEQLATMMGEERAQYENNSQKALEILKRKDEEIRQLNVAVAAAPERSATERQLRADLAEKTAKLIVVEEENAKLRVQMSEPRNPALAGEAAFGGDVGGGAGGDLVEHYNRRIADLEAQLAIFHESQTKNVELQQQLDEMRREQTGMADRLIKAREEKTSVVEKLHKALAVDSGGSDTDDASDIMGYYGRRIRELEEDLAGMQGRNVELQNQLDGAAGERDELAAVVEQAAQERAAVVDEFVGAESRHAEFQHQLDSALVERDELAERVVQLQQDKDNAVRELRTSIEGDIGSNQSKRLDAMSELLALDVESLAMDRQPASPNAGLGVQLRQTTSALSESQAALKPLQEKCAKLELLLNKMESERENLYADIDGERARALQLEGELQEAVDQFDRERRDFKQKLNRSARSMSHNESGQQSEEEKELTLLAQDDALFTAQLTELEAELQSVQEQLRNRTAELAKLQNKQRRASSGHDSQSERSGKGAGSAGPGALDKKLRQANEKCLTLSDDNGRLRERVTRLEKLHALAKDMALKAEAEQERAAAAALESDRRLRAQMAGQKRHQEHVERRLEEAEIAVDKARAELSSKDAVIRELLSAPGAPDATAAEVIHVQQKAKTDFSNQRATQSVVNAELRRLEAAHEAAKFEWQTTEESYKAEIATQKHECTKIKMQMRSLQASKTSREKELEETVERLSRRSKMHQSMNDMSAKMTGLQSAANAMQAEVDALRLENEHASDELQRKTERLAQVEEQLYSKPDSLKIEMNQQRLRAVIQENTSLQDSLKAARAESDLCAQKLQEVQNMAGDVDELRSKLAAGSSQWEQQQRAGEDIREKHAVLEQTVSQLNIQLSGAKQNAFALESEMQQRLAASEAQHAEGRYSLLHTSQERAATIEALESKAKRYQDASVQHARTMASMEESIRQLQEQCETRVAKAIDETNAIRKEACQCVSENERLHILVDEKDRQLSTIQESINAMRSPDEETVQQQVIVLISHLDQSHAAQCELERRLGEMQGAIQGHVVEFSSLQRELSVVTNELRDRKIQLEAKRKAKEVQEEDIHELRLELSEVQQMYEDVQKELSLHQQRSADDGKQVQELIEQMRQQQHTFYDSLHKEKATNEATCQELRLRVLQLEHDADKGGGDTAGAGGPQAEMCNQLQIWTAQLKACCAACGTADLDALVRTTLNKYDGALSKQAKDLALCKRLNGDLQLQCQCHVKTQQVLEIQLVQCREAKTQAESKSRAMGRQLHDSDLQKKTDHRSMVEVLQERVELLSTQLRQIKEQAKEHMGAKTALEVERNELRQQLDKAERELAVASTVETNDLERYHTDLEEKNARLREFFEAELARLSSIGSDEERMKEIGQQLTASKMMEDDFRMRTFSLEQQRDVLLTDCVVLKDTIRKLETELQTMQRESYNNQTAGVPHEDILSLEDGAATLRTELEVARQREKTLSSRVAELEGLLRSSNAECSELKLHFNATERERVEEMHVRHQEELKELNEQQFKYRAEQEHTSRNLQEELDTAKHALLASSANTGVTPEFEQSMQQLRADAERVMGENAKLVEANAELRDQLAGMKEELSDSNATLTDLENALGGVSVINAGVDRPIGKQKGARVSNDPAAVLGRKLAAAQAGLSNAKRQLRVSEKLELELRQQLKDKDNRIGELKQLAASTSADQQRNPEAAGLRRDLLRKEQEVESLKLEIDQQQLNRSQVDVDVESSAGASGSFENSDALQKKLDESQHNQRVLEEAVEQLSTQLAGSTSNTAASFHASSRSRHTLRRPPQPKKSAIDKGAGKIVSSAIEKSQRIVIDKLRSEVDALRVGGSELPSQNRRHQVEGMKSRADAADAAAAESVSAEKFASCLAEIAEAVEKIAALFQTIRPEPDPGGVELTQPEKVLRNIEGECTTIRFACERGGATVNAVSEPVYDHSKAPPSTPSRANEPLLKRKISDLERQLSVVQREHAHASRQYTELKMRFGNATTDLGQAMNGLQVMGSTIDSLTESKRQLLVRVDKLQKALAAHSAGTSDRDADALWRAEHLRVSDERAVGAERNLLVAREQSIVLEAEHEAKEARVQQQLQTTADELKRLQDAVAAHAKQIDDPSAAGAGAGGAVGVEENGEPTGQIQELERDLVAAREQLQAADALCAEQRRKEATIQNSLQVTAAELQEMQLLADCNAAAGSQSSLGSTNSNDAETIIQRAQELEAAIRAKNGQLQERQQELESLNAQMAEAATSWTDQLKALEETNERLQNGLHSRDAEIAQLSSEVSARETEIREMVSKRAAASADKKALEICAKDAHSRTVDTERQITELQQQCKKAQHEQKIAERRLKKVEGEKAAAVAAGQQAASDAIFKEKEAEAIEAAMVMQKLTVQLERLQKQMQHEVDERQKETGRRTALEALLEKQSTRLVIAVEADSPEEDFVTLTFHSLLCVCSWSLAPPDCLRALAKPWSAGCSLASMKQRHKLAGKGMSQAKAEAARLKEQLDVIDHSKSGKVGARDGEKGIKSRLKDAKDALKHMQAEGAKKGQIILDLKVTQQQHAGEFAAAVEAKASAEEKAKQLSRDCVRKDKLLQLEKSKQGEKEAAAADGDKSQSMLEGRVSQLTSSLGRKDNKIRALETHVGELTSQVGLFQMEQENSAGEAARKTDSKYYELYSRSKHDLARKDGIIRGLQTRIEQLTVRLMSTPRQR